MGGKTLYSILGIDEQACAVTIETAYRERRGALEGQGCDVDELSLLRVAYETLRNPVTRQRYDEKQVAMAAERSKIVMTDGDCDVSFGPGRRTGRLWAILVLIPVTVLVFWSVRSETAADKPLAAAIKPAESTPGGDQKTEVLAASRPVVTAQPIPTLLPPYPPSADARVDVQETVVIMDRPPRSGGFDAQYLAWSAYFVVRPGAVTGSGVMVAPDKILTNCHVLAGAGLSGIAVMNSATRKKSRVKEYARLDDDDACLLHAPGAGNDAIEWGRSANLKSGDATHTFGHPGGSSDLIWSSGEFVRRMPVSGRGEDVLITNNYCRPGSSGGPLLDGHGKLVGMVTAVQRFASASQENLYGLCLSVTEATARELLHKPMFPIAMAPSFYKKNY